MACQPRRLPRALFWPRLALTFCAIHPLRDPLRIELVLPLLTRRFLIPALVLSAVFMTPAASAIAATCGTGTFEAWLTDFKTEAAAKGISQAAITSGLNGVTLDKSVLARDHSQAVFNQSFEQFSGRMVQPRLLRGSNMLKQYDSAGARIEYSHGVPGEVIVAVWG